MTPIKQTPLITAPRLIVIGVVVALVMSLGTQTTMAQDGRRRAGAVERIGLESLGAGVGMLGAGLIGVITGLATSIGSLREPAGRRATCLRSLPRAKSRKTL